MNQDEDDILLEESQKDKRAKVKFIKKRATQLVNDAKCTDFPIRINQIVQYLKTEMKVNIHFRMMEMNKRYSGQYIRIDNEVGIICNKIHHQNRQRFTIAHELGHFVLNHGFKVNEHLEVENFKTKSPIEREANIFAAELLMPKQKLLSYLKEHKVKNPNDLAVVFEVSSEAMWFKISEDNLLAHFSP